MSALLPPSFPPRADPAWNEAHERVESYLRAHRIAQPITLSELTNEIVARAWQDRSTDSSLAPVTRALREADNTITAWFARDGVYRFRVLTAHPWMGVVFAYCGRLDG